MNQTYKTFPRPSRAGAKVSAREGVETKHIQAFTPIPTFPLKRGRSHAIELPI